MEPEDDKTHTHITLARDTMVGHYRIVEKIGAGGMGEVYLAQDTQLDRKVALKFLPPHLCQDEECRKRFKREAQAAAKLDHPNIISVYEVSEYHGRPYFAMAHVEGRSLKEFVAGKDLSVEQILELAIQICGGLHAAHERGVTHRDIKPSNILIDSYGRARIVDFGLASVRDADQLTKTGSTMGTIGYMSPEQVQGKEVDHRSDLFSLGVVLYELITKQNPFRRETEAATLKAVSDDYPEPLARFKRDIPEGMQAVIDKALEKDVNTRYQHADGLCSDLMRVKRSLESTHTAITGVPVKKKHETLWWVAGSVIVMVIIVLLSTRPWESSRTPSDTDGLRLVVLPFDNLGDPDDEYFADGITDEITSRLSEISNLSVVSRTSAYAFKDSNITIPEIGKAVGAQYVLEGTIRWVKSGGQSRVRITPQLIDVERDMHIWSDRYDRAVSDVLSLQTEIARRVADELNASLSTGEDLTSATVGAEAYQYYLMGKSYFNERRFPEARQMYSRAIASDSGFALAYAGLSETISNLDYWSTREHITPLERVMAKKLAEKSLQLKPDLVQGLRALGSYYHLVMVDYPAAIDYLDQALKLDPEDVGTNGAAGQLMLHAGDYQAAVNYLEKALAADPTHASNARSLSRAYTLLRRYDDAKAVMRRALSFHPSDNDLWAGMAYTEFVAAGMSGELPHIIKQAQKNVADFYSPGNNLLMPDLYDMYLGNFDTVIWRIKDHGLAVYESRIDQIDTGAYYSYLALVCYHGGYGAAAKIYADSSRQYGERRLARLQDADIPAGARGAWLLTDLADAYALMGNKTKALELADQVLAMEPLKRDGYQGPWAIVNLAAVLVVAQEHDRAIELLETLLNVPSYTSVACLRDDPFFKPLRDHPRFKALLEKYEKIHGT